LSLTPNAGSSGISFLIGNDLSLTENGEQIRDNAMKMSELKHLLKQKQMFGEF